MNVPLAIIIPAYKATYLAEALESLALQTCRNFNVYVGDDCSPDNIKAIVDKFSDRLNIFYHRFEDNLGWSDLIAQWERCIDLVNNNEDFICLFSDDDLMLPDNIELFYKKLSETRIYDVYHFDIDVIDAGGKVLLRRKDFPEIMTSSDFFSDLYKRKIEARMPEFIFKLESFKKKGGLVRFDLAYRSDNATVMLHASEHGISTVRDGRVLWRDSGGNVSSSKNPILNERRVRASINFFNWLETFFKGGRFPLPLIRRIKIYANEALCLYPAYTPKELYAIMKEIDFLRRNPFCLWLAKLRLNNKISRINRRAS